MDGVGQASDEALLQAWRDGDRSAANELLERHFGLIHRFFWRRLPHQAEDLAQQTFVGCVERRDALRGTFRAYLFGIARNRLRLALRAKTPEAGGIGDPAASLTSPSGKLARREEERLLLDALRTLDPSTQLVIEMHYWEGLTVREIAELVEMPLGTVKTRIREGRLRLRELIETAPAAPPLIRSTLDDFERWARGMRAPIPRPA